MRYKKVTNLMFTENAKVVYIYNGTRITELDASEWQVALEEI